MDFVYRRSDDVDLIEIAKSLYDSNTRPQRNVLALEDTSTVYNENSLLHTDEESEFEYRTRIITDTNHFVHESIEEKNNVILGESQCIVVQYWITELCAIKSAMKFGTFNENYQMPLILMLGLPGTGKSFVIDVISQCVSYLKLGIVLKTAHYGIAAMNISGSTLHKLFKINCHEGINSKSELRDQDLIDLQTKLQSKSLFMIVIDEISNVPPHLFQRVNRRLQSIRNCDKPFGGLAVLLVGDFLQKKPPASIPLVHGLMYLVVTEDINERKEHSDFVPTQQFPYKKKRIDGLRDQNSNTYLGLKLFERFQLLMLKEQQRASQDIEHVKLLEKMCRQESKVRVEDFNIYQHLSKQDMDGDFQDATFIVSTNRERHNVSFHMAQVFAIKHKTPIIRWRLEVKQWLNRPNIQEEFDLIDKDPIFYDHFVKGIDCYCTENINPTMMVGNGTKVKLHSLVFETIEQENHVLRMVTNSEGGQIITIPFAPICVNVELYHDNFNEKIKKQLQRSSVPFNGRTNISMEQKIVVSILKSKIGGKLKPMPTIVTPTCCTPSRVFIQRMFPLELSAAVTVDKAQGRTLKKVVACLSQRCDNLYEMDINSIFVALSRVRKKNDLRLLIHSDSTTSRQLKYIEHLCQDREYFDYMGGFQGEKNQPQTWNRTSALHKMAQNINHHN